MANRYSALNRRPGAGGAAASSLFADYPGSRPSSNPPQNRSSYALPADSARSASPYYTGPSQAQPTSRSYNSTPTGLPGTSSPFQSYPRSASPSKSKSNSQNYNSTTSNSSYTSTAVLDHLEAQNESTQTSLLSSKVSQLKQLSIAIGDEIRDSSSLAQTINDSFENTSVKLKGTMKRMLRMAERTGVGWKVWLGFFAAVWLIFVYVWLF